MKGHGGVLTIDLAAIRRNWQCMRNLLVAGGECGAVIKANAYGLGADRVSKNLYAAGCRTFFVATVDEGIDARQYLPPAATIYVLDGIRPGQELSCVTHQLAPVLFTREQLQRWAHINRQADNKRPCAVKVDTGMARLGLPLEEFYQLCGHAELIKACNPNLLMSHLACADEPDHPLNVVQLERFRQAREKMTELNADVRLSFANSSGMCLGADWHFDLTRPGAALYGVNPQPGHPSMVEPVVQLDLPIIQIREVEAGTHIGYGATCTVDKPARLAVALGGYADGILRAISNRGVGLLAGRRVPVVGRVSMDSVVFDISDIPPTELPQEGEGTIALLSPTLTVDEFGQAAGTIGYEVLTSLGDRYQRLYIHDLSDPVSN